MRIRTEITEGVAYSELKHLPYFKQLVKNVDQTILKELLPQIVSRVLLIVEDCSEPCLDKRHSPRPNPKNSPNHREPRSRLSWSQPQPCEDSQLLAMLRLDQYKYVVIHPGREEATQRANIVVSTTTIDQFPDFPWKELRGGCEFARITRRMHEALTSHLRLDILLVASMRTLEKIHFYETCTATVEHYNSFVYRHGDEVLEGYYVVQGRVKVYVEYSGCDYPRGHTKRKLVQFVEAGSYFGY